MQVNLSVYWVYLINLSGSVMDVSLSITSV